MGHSEPGCERELGHRTHEPLVYSANDEARGEVRVHVEDVVAWWGWGVRFVVQIGRTLALCITEISTPLTTKYEGEVMVNTPYLIQAMNSLNLCTSFLAVAASQFEHMTARAARSSATLMSARLK